MADAGAVVNGGGGRKGSPLLGYCSAGVDIVEFGRHYDVVVLDVEVDVEVDELVEVEVVVELVVDVEDVVDVLVEVELEVVVTKVSSSFLHEAVVPEVAVWI